MPQFKVESQFGISINGKVFFKGDTFTCEKKRVEKHLGRGNVKELKDTKITKELKAKVNTK